MKLRPMAYLEGKEKGELIGLERGIEQGIGQGLEQGLEQEESIYSRFKLSTGLLSAALTLW
jgi:hypothetical protein